MSSAVGNEEYPGNFWGKPIPPSLLRMATEQVATKDKEEKTMTQKHFEDVDFDDDAEVAVATQTEINTADPTDAELLEEENAAAYDEESEYEAAADVDAEDEDDEFSPEEGDAAEVEYAEAEETEDDEAVSSPDELEENVAATAAKPRKREKPMTGKITLSDRIRKEIASRKEAGKSLRGVDIRTALERKGYPVSAAQISQILKKEGIPQIGRGPSKNKDKLAAVETEPTSKPEKRRGRRPREAAKVATQPAAPIEPRARKKQTPLHLPSHDVPTARLLEQLARAQAELLAANVEFIKRLYSVLDELTPD